MNPDYLWLTESLELATLFLIGPGIAIFISCAAWRGRLRDFHADRLGMLCVGSGVTALLLFGLAKWMNTDVRSPRYFLQVACVLLSGLLFGVCMGCGFSLQLRTWHWHKKTRLKNDNRSKE